MVRLETSSAGSSGGDGEAEHYSILFSLRDVLLGGIYFFLATSEVGWCDSSLLGIRGRDGRRQGYLQSAHEGRFPRGTRFGLTESILLFLLSLLGLDRSKSFRMAE